MEQTICESCAMPLTSEDMYSTEKDGSINKDYCKWCYKDGEFVDKVFHGRVYRDVLEVWRTGRYDERANERILHQSFPNAQKMEESVIWI